MTVTDTELITAFVNTLHKEPAGGDEESFATTAGLGAWLREQGLLGSEAIDDADLGRAIELREALRTLLLSNNGADVDAPAAWAVVEAAAGRARIELHFPDGAPELLVVAGGVDGALGRVLVAVNAAIVERRWPRLKACRASDCEWAFDDATKNQSRAWCSMRSCGNREKARAFRRRHGPGINVSHGH